MMVQRRLTAATPDPSTKRRKPPTGEESHDFG